ncbi:MAG: NUDIX domain-containing protein [Acidobacteriota bacterium]
MSDKTPEQHRNDIYAKDLDDKSSTPAIPAATVVLLRQRETSPEVLMLRKNSKIAFGGMWVFPGGRIDEEDYPADRDLEGAARVAAAREAAEEAAVTATPEEFVWFAHWTPPPSSPKRFATYFFATVIEGSENVQIDGGEVLDHMWIAPAEALAKHGAGDIDLAPPTWVTLYHLTRRATARAVIDDFSARAPRHYATRIGQRADGVRVAIWEGDGAYEHGDADAEGTRHRLVMAKGGFEFEHPPEDY